MESIKIVMLSIAAGAMYGVVHDQITARICIEYFTVFHPRILESTSPTLLGLTWGIVATWWAGAILGLALAVAARAGSREKFDVADVLPMILRLLLIMVASAASFGIAGFVLAGKGLVYPPLWVQGSIPASRFPNFMADWWAHNASYGSAFVGGAVLCALVYIKRQSIMRETSQAPQRK